MLAYALAVVFGVASVADVPDPRPTSAVSDQAHVLDATQTATLNALAHDLHAARGIELAIVTVDDTPAASKPFATELFNTWKLGNAHKNNGLLVLLVMGKRRVEVETGKGIDAALAPDWLAQMQKDAMVPKFKQKDFAGGLAAGVQAISDHLRAAGGESTSSAPAGEYMNNGVVTDHPMPAITPPAPPVRTPPRYDHDEKTGLMIGVIAAVVLVLGCIVGVIVWIRRPRRTGQIRADGTYIYRGDDDDDDYSYSGPRVRTSFWDFFGSSSGSSSSSSSSSSDYSSSSSDSSSSDSSSSGGSSDGGGAGSDW